MSSAIEVACDVDWVTVPLAATVTDRTELGAIFNEELGLGFSMRAALNCRSDEKHKFADVSPWGGSYTFRLCCGSSGQGRVEKLSVFNFIN